MNYAIVTVDTEGHDGIFPIEKLILGETEHGNFGISKIMDICDEFYVKALFFVDIAECWDYGEKKIKNVINMILSRGHFAGVHVHPDHMADKGRPFLWEYSYEEQCDILTRATDMFHKLTGEAPRFFRAGKYGANRTTLSILQELGYQYDFSQFYGQKWCGIDPPVAINLPHKIGEIVEIPVTTFSVCKIGAYEKFEKIDMEMYSRQFDYAIRKFNEGDNMIISLFLHSFSLLEWRKNPNTPTHCISNTQKLRSALETISHQTNICFCDAAKLDEIIPSMLVGEKETKPFLQVRNPFVSCYLIFLTAFRIASFNMKARFLIGTIIMIILGLMVILLLLLL